mgnify:CR=1 FL=1
MSLLFAFLLAHSAFNPGSVLVLSHHGHEAIVKLERRVFRHGERGLHCRGLLGKQLCRMYKLLLVLFKDVQFVLSLSFIHAVLLNHLMMLFGQ